MYWVEPRIWRDLMNRQPLVAAFCISLMIHATLFGTWRLGKHLHWWDHQATWLLNLTKKRVVKVSAKQLQALQQRQREIQLTFIEVDPASATPEPPKDAKFYGVANAKAANPDVTVETEKPKADGNRTEIPRTETVLRPQPLQPSIPPPDTPKSQPPGDLAKAKTEPERSDTVTIPTKEKPRTLAAARTQKNLTGEKVKQDGGVKRHGQLNFDVKATSFGAYDAAFIAAVQQRWFDILDNTSFTQRSGKVVLEFRLRYDGQIVELREAETEVGEVLGLICQKAVLDPAPYAPWPRDMRLTFPQGYRDVRFTFIYY
jgi:hypothetical protein